MDKVISFLNSILNFIVDLFPFFAIFMLCIILILMLIVQCNQPEMVYDVDVNGVLYEKVSYNFGLLKTSVRLDFMDGNWVQINNVERFEILAEYCVDELVKGGGKDEKN